MFKLGQMYLQDGFSGEIQVVSSAWVQEVTSLKATTGWPRIEGYGYLWWLPETGYLAIGYGGQFIVVIPDLNLVIGAHSLDYSTALYQNQLLNYFYESIAPLFEVSKK